MVIRARKEGEPGNEANCRHPSLLLGKKASIFLSWNASETHHEMSSL